MGYPDYGLFMTLRQLEDIGFRQEIYKMGLQNFIVPGSKEAITD